MKLYYDKRLSDPTYYIQIGIRNGKKVSSKNIKKIGKHSELLKITDDPLEYAKNEVKKLNDEKNNGKVSFNYTTDYNKKIEDANELASSSTTLNIGYFFLQYIIQGLGLKDFFQKISQKKKITFDCYTILRFLTYERIINPCSKLETTVHLQNYFEKPNFEYQHILRFMDILEENYSSYMSTLYQNSDSIFKRNTSVMYYDCTNFYFEIEREDEAIIDDVTGELIPGLRKFGISKEHRPNPLVEMGIFMDMNGIPVTMSIHSGNTNEQETAIPLEKELINTIENSKFIYCADAGLGSYNIRKFNSLGGRAFIVTQSIKKLSETLQKAVFNDNDYRLLSSNKKITLEEMKSFDKNDPQNLDLYNDFAYKVINADRLVDLGLYEEKKLKNGSTKKVKATGQLKQKLIIRFSRKMMEYQHSVRQRQIERAEKLLELKDPEEVKKGPHDVRRFMKRIIKNSSEEDTKIEYVLDTQKIKEEEKYDGFYAVATNLDDSAKDILKVMEKRYQIEECFRIMKSNFNGRPVNHRLPERIKAHFTICYTALLVYRLLENKLEEKKIKITPDMLVKTLKNLNVNKTNEIDFVSLYKNSDILKGLNMLTGLELDMLHNTPNKLSAKIKKIL